MSSTIIGVDAFHVQVPVRLIADGGIAPYAGSQDAHGVTTAQSLLVRVRTDDGISGWGEMNTGFDRAVDVALVKHWIEPALVGQDATRIRATMDRVDAPYWPQFGRRALACAAEMALWDVTARSMGRRVADLLGGPVRDRVDVAFCLGITDAATSADVARRALDGGWRAFKTKVGTDLDADLERIQAIVDATGRRLRLRLDANQAYDRITALTFLREAAAFPIEYIEQPLPVGDYAGHRALVERGLVPIAINEDAYTAGGVARAASERSIDAAVVDIEAAGGVGGLLELAAVGAAFHIPLAHHCGWDLGVKTAMMLQVVAATPAIGLASDSTYAMHLDDILAARLETKDGSMPLPDGPGIGVDIDDDAVERLTWR
ncbi:mandelate racemase/muconate lactonizing enzyme family protein [Jiangella gansuensis]|uniref:mandelate racemase/muconate lactonizing enzyme family protein n=1 Tax=Jiangella gansuensis TaxID=281473 RepID=UPI0004B56264|nr:mandelate racemase/muconate lactonizing enzyme family protein [Jiangella gansuensis]